MQYCEKCRILCDTQCPVCGNRRLVTPQAQAPARLALVQGQQAAALETLLQENRLPYEKHPAVSPDASEIPAYHFYVPTCRFQEAQESLKTVFSQNQEGHLQPPLPKPLQKPQTYRVGGEEFEEMPRKKRIFWRAFSAVLFLGLVMAVIFVSDAAAGWLKNLFTT